MNGALQHALPTAAAMFEQTGQRSCPVAVLCESEVPASHDDTKLSERTASFVMRCDSRRGMMSLQSSQAMASTIGAAMTATKRVIMKNTVSLMSGASYVFFFHKSTANRYQSNLNGKVLA
jgi:hypothetical protein